ncbi:unnamed protein product [Blepharisma stoltei]|uniref:Uncharacterized protein n=1 Tax=Blepharisma stoltei TaxID=1481888 RepID=A0AAU9IW09_9CILI|nr:unnamed protein product [Blepharisma stoltei]
MISLSNKDLKSINTQTSIELNDNAQESKINKIQIRIIHRKDSHQKISNYSKNFTEKILNDSQTVSLVNLNKLLETNTVNQQQAVAFQAGRCWSRSSTSRNKNAESVSPLPSEKCLINETGKVERYFKVNNEGRLEIKDYPNLRPRSAFKRTVDSSWPNMLRKSTPRIRVVDKELQSCFIQSKVGLKPKNRLLRKVSPCFGKKEEKEYTGYLSARIKHYSKSMLKNKNS